jgi:hypothetical protein
MIEVREARPGGGYETAKRAMQSGETVRLRGFAHEINKSPDWPIVGGYGLTFNVDADFMTKWLTANADLDMVKNGLIFIHEKPEYVQKQAREKRDLRSGLEPGRPDKFVKGITKADDKAA